ncbi:hypothetical protein [Herbidospora mongoliensis]|uniref:hypothetical protein n=1 Tax=Herbidospora mongoliensis TaxID=688067 RepID=UPI0012FA4818|nr:hypothetical protein [Herbidospora mongoliensis]
MAAVSALMSVLACGGQATESTAPPTGVSVALQQWRSDVAVHRIQVSVTNTSTTPLRITDLRLDSGSFEPSAPVKVDTTLGMTPRTDFPITYGRARCDATAIPPVKPTDVVATMAVGDAPAKEVRFPIPVTDGLLTQLVKYECGEYILKQSATIAFGPGFTRKGDDLKGTLVVTGTRHVTIDDIDGTTHYVLKPEKRRPVAVVDPGTSDIPVTIRPTRCDPHAFAEAKQAYLFQVWGHTEGGETYRMIVTPPRDIQEELLAYAIEVCDFPAT